MTAPLLQQALEALEQAKKRFSGQEWVPRIQSAIGDIDAAITAIRSHLEEPKGEPVTDEDPDGYPGGFDMSDLADIRKLLTSPPSDTVSRDAREREQLAIGRAIERACEQLPHESDGIEIRLERDAGTVYYLKDGYWVHIDSGDTFSSQISAAIDAAMHSSTPTVGGG